MKNVCAISGTEFEITDFEQDFLKKIAPTFAGEKFEIPLPDIAPMERARVRTAHRNEQFLFRNKNFFTGKSMVSVYRDDCGRKVCSRDEWFGDKWDAIDFGRDFDDTKSFFSQFHELQKDVPYATTVTFNNESSEYTTGTGFCKHCYLINSSENCEDCLYGKLLQKCTSVMDTAFAYHCELLYECFNVEKCYDCKWVYYSQGCHDCWFCDDCRGCHHCFLCTNLVKQDHCFMNQKLSKEEYEKRVSDFLSDHVHITKAKELFEDLRKKRIYKYANIVNGQNCTGDFITNSKNCQECYDMNDSEDCMHVQLGFETKDLLDCSNMYVKPEVSYQTLGTIGTFNCHFCLYAFNSADLWYCEQMFSCKNCFGCVGLRNKQYCIFNKKFTKEEYEKEVARIIRSMKGAHSTHSVRSSPRGSRLSRAGSEQSSEWGKFFPVTMSPFPYNDTVAHGYFPLTEADVAQRGWRWGEKETLNYQTSNYKIPKSIKEVTDGILAGVLQCDTCSKNYKLQRMELDFYRKMKLPVSRTCPDCRYEARMRLRNPRTLHPRTCSACNVAVQSPFPPESEEKICCEKCYLEKVN
jgi:hypothetical protein